MNNLKQTVPKATLQRFPVYLKALRKLDNLGVQRIMSRELSEFVLKTTCSVLQAQRITVKK